jgi:hypothetical protein
MMSSTKRRQQSDMAQLLPAGDEQLSQILRCIHVAQHHGHEPRVIVLGITIDHDAVILEDCCCPGDLANFKRALTPIPTLHVERGRDKDGSLARYGHQVSLL